MKLAVDLDGVVFDFVKATRNLIPEVPANPEMVDIATYIKKENMTLFNNLLNSNEFFLNLPLTKDFEEVIPELNKHDFYIVTSRNKSVARATIEAVVNKHLNPIDIVMTKKKGQFIVENNIYGLIEDQTKYVKQVPTSKLIIMPNLGYNKGIENEQNNIIKYNNNYELLRILKEMKPDYV